MNTKELTTAILALCAANAEGFTSNVTDMQPVPAGYSVAVQATQNSFGKDGARAVANYIANHPNVNAVGGWYDSESGRYYIDAVMIFDNLESALIAGRAEDQLAIFDLNQMEEIRL